MGDTAQGSQHGLSYVEETTYGETPATPSMLRLRHTDTDLSPQKGELVSDEKRSDRQIVDVRHGNLQTNGSVDIELSYGAFDDFLKAALFGDWETDAPEAGTDQLKAGTTRHSFSIERRFEDISRYHLYTGMMVNSMSLSIQTESMVTGQFSLVGKGISVGSTSAGSPSDVATNSPFDSFTGEIREGGSTIGIITQLDIELNNNIEPNFALMQKDAISQSTGRSNLTGTLNAYFQSDDLLQKFLDETESELQFDLTDLDGNSYTFIIPRIKYNGGNAPVSDEGSIVMELPFQALRDPVEETNIIVERTPV